MAQKNIGLVELNMNSTKTKKKYWYRIHINECCVCGVDLSWKERVYGKKPKRLSKIYIHDGKPYCGCMDRDFY